MSDLHSDAADYHARTRRTLFDEIVNMLVLTPVVLQVLKLMESQSGGLMTTDDVINVFLELTFDLKKKYVMRALIPILRHYRDSLGTKIFLCCQVSPATDVVSNTIISS